MSLTASYYIEVQLFFVKICPLFMQKWGENPIFGIFIFSILETKKNSSSLILPILPERRPWGRVSGGMGGFCGGFLGVFGMFWWCSGTILHGFYMDFRLEIQSPVNGTPPPRQALCPLWDGLLLKNTPQITSRGTSFTAVLVKYYVKPPKYGLRAN